MQLCEVPWCVAYAKPDAKACSVHGRFRTFKPDADLNIECDECGGIGDCDACGGDGEHRCSDYRCDAMHECGACDGSGICAVCLRKALTLEPDERRYLDAAQAEGWQPTPLFDRPWEEAA